jgi:hypothetical protein
MKPWRQARPYWDHCAGEILKAADSGKRTDIVEATRCLEVALATRGDRDIASVIVTPPSANPFRPCAGKRIISADLVLNNNFDRLARRIAVSYGM